MCLVEVTPVEGDAFATSCDTRGCARAGGSKPDAKIRRMQKLQLELLMADHCRTARAARAMGRAN